MKLKGLRQSPRVTRAQPAPASRTNQIKALERRMGYDYVPDELIGEKGRKIPMKEVRAAYAAQKKRQLKTAKDTLSKLPKKVRDKADADLNAALKMDKKENKKAGTDKIPLFAKGKRIKQ